MKTGIVLLLLIANTTIIKAQIHVGEKINLAALNIKPLNNAMVSKNKVLVVDFWATWCAPCIAAFPHLDSIQQEYGNKVQVIALTDEPTAKVQQFLHKRNYTISFFNDPGKEVFSLFQVESRPLSTILKSDGTIIWVGYTSEIRNILNIVLTNSGKENISFPSAFASLKKYYPLDELQKTKKYFDYQIEKSSPKDEYEAKTQKGSYADSAIDIYYSATSVTEILSDLYEITDLQLSNSRTDLDTTLLNIIAKSSDKKISYQKEKKKIIQDLTMLFDFTITSKSKTVDAYLLKIEKPDKLASHSETIDGGGMVQSVENKYIVTRLSLQQLAGFIQNKLKIFVSFENPDAKKYNLEIQKFETVLQLNKELMEKYGIQLTPSKMNIQTFEIN